MVDKKKSYESYKKVSTLGVGSFGTAFLVQCQSDQAYAVIKQIDISEMTEEERKETLREAKILEVLNHPNITRFREVYKTKKGKLCIVMDYCDDGDLQTKIRNQSKVKNAQGRTVYFSEDEVFTWITQVCLALKHTHDKKILHRDLKSQNIFMTKRGILKLGDFGIARVLSNTRSRAKTVVGTPYYLSPEIIKNTGYSFKSDIWSLGVLLYEMAALQPPFNAASLHQLAQKIVAGKYSPLPQSFSMATSQLVAAMLQVDPEKRPSVHQILKMPQIQPRIKQFLEGDTFKTEFAHTILHNQDVFEEFRRAQQAKQKQEDQPKQFFSQQYNQYIGDLDKEQPPKAKEDDEETGLYTNKAQPQERPVTNHSLPQASENVTQAEMINITSCEFQEFSAYMSKLYGAVKFKQGFEIVKTNRDLVYADDGEEKMIKLLDHLFQTDEQIRGFLNFVTTYLIVQGI